MTPEHALTQAKNLLDEATENLTFEAYDWAFEEVWHGVGWLLNAMHAEPLEDIGTGSKGEWPKPGSLHALLSRAQRPPTQSKVAVALERLRMRLPQDLALVHEDIERAIFLAWELHDACGLRMRVPDDRLDGKWLLTDVSPGRIGSPVIERRTALKLFAVGSLLPLQACSKVERDNRLPAASQAPVAAPPESTRAASIASVTPISGMHWETTDPFLFCAHHNDAFPVGNDAMGPAASLAGRHIGRDFESIDNWNMYHGRTVPGFPRHPHRGFETVTVVRSGLLDHSDSMGATARYGNGDVQWLTAGGGIQHAEMFPLLRNDSPNPLELFQIWLNLPKSRKMSPPHFTMLWAEKIPRVTHTDGAGRITELTVSAGRYQDAVPPSPPPNSYASMPESDLAIWTLRMEAGATFVLPAVGEGTWRSLYVFRGAGARFGETDVPNLSRVQIRENGTLALTNGAQESEILLLQARPIAEPVAKRGPFVMNTQDEIRQAFADYQATEFGGWPWPADDPVHVRKQGRFARNIDGSFEEPT